MTLIAAWAEFTVVIMQVLYKYMFYCISLSSSGFVDIFSKSKDRLKAHASKILKFLHRNRIPSSAIPFPVLEGYNSICTMRSSVVQDFLDYLLQKEKGEKNSHLINI